MKLTLIRSDVLESQTPCLIVGVFQDEEFSGLIGELDDASGGTLKRLLERGDFIPRYEKTLLVIDPPGLAAERLLLVGLGKRTEFNASRYQGACSIAIKRISQTQIATAICGLTLLKVPGHDQRWRSLQAALVSTSAAYRYTATKNAIEHEWRLAELGLPGQDEVLLSHAAAIAKGVLRAREMGNLPANICTPAYMRSQAEQIAKAYDNVSLEVLDRKAMQALNMGALLGVAKGSAHEPCLIVLQYRAGGDAPPYALVGKGVTFDAGGISIKPSKGMEEMKFDMGGAAAVIGALESCAELRLPLNLVVVVPAVENMPDGNAYRPGDVVTSYSGQTIEVVNTDAEGRLILCDALTYVQRFKPQAVIDAATLTGACAVALGKHASALMTSDDELAEQLITAGEKTGDRAWRLPIWEEYYEQLDTPFADMANVGGPTAGAIVAACFLARFTTEFRWAHLDIAGTAWDIGTKNGATGRPVGLLVQYLLDRSEKP